jgi:N-methylhydantoinase A/oxoprolinase/acetone carboxylase beta subunit
LEGRYVTWSLAVDIGGTFTDAVLRGDDGALVVDKTLTTHQTCWRASSAASTWCWARRA